MRRIYRRLFMVVWSLALAITTTAITIAAPAQATTIADQTGQRKALHQSEWSRTSRSAPSSGTG